MGEKMTQDNQNEEYMTLVDDDGNESLFSVLFTFHSDEYNKDYILFYPAGSEEQEEVDIQAFSFEPDQDGLATDADLLPIEDDTEWSMVEEVLNTFLEDEDNQS